jgi:hypothetical protein
VSHITTPTGRVDHFGELTEKELNSYLEFLGKKFERVPLCKVILQIDAYLCRQSDLLWSKVTWQ